MVMMKDFIGVPEGGPLIRGLKGIQLIISRVANC